MAGRTTSVKKTRITKSEPGTDAPEPGDESSSETETDTGEDGFTPYRTGAVVRKRKNNRKYDWDLLRKQYIEGIDDDEDEKERHWPTIRELAEIHDLAHSRIGERASQERWNDRKEIYQNQLATERRAERVKKLGKESIEFSEQSLNTARLGMRLVMGRLAEIGRDFAAHSERRNEIENQIRNNQVIGDLADLRSPVYYKEMEALAGAAQRFQDMGLKALGEDVQRHEITGKDGAPIQAGIDIRTEMERDDPERLAKLMEAMIEAGIPGLFVKDENEDDETIIDAEEVEEDGSQPGIEGQTTTDG